MIKEIWYCDICGKEYSSKQIPFINRKYRIKFVDANENRSYVVDLCRNCQKNLMQYLRDNINNEEEKDE